MTKEVYTTKSSQPIYTNIILKQNQINNQTAKYQIIATWIIKILNARALSNVNFETKDLPYIP